MNAAHNIDTSINPLETLSAALDDDMKAVNAQILTHMQSDVPLIKQLAGYLIASGGKRIRPLLTLASTALFTGDMQRAHNLAAAVEFIHTATLLHDDVVDESDTRRGKAAANHVFGNSASVLVGDFLFARAFQRMTADGEIRVLKSLSDASAIITEGEVKQLILAGNINTTLDDYLDVIKSKTAALFAAACEVGPIIGGQDDQTIQALYNYGLNLGIAFQIADDTLDYTSDAATMGKEVGDDFREGKITAPVFMALQKADNDEKQFWAGMFDTESDFCSDPANLTKAKDIITRHGAIDQANTLAQSYADKAQAALRTVQESQKRPDILGALLDLTTYVINRKA